MIISSEADIKKIANLADRREVRNFGRWLRLWPIHGFDMIARPRWQKYLGLSADEVVAWQAATAKRAIRTASPSP